MKRWSLLAMAVAAAAATSTPNSARAQSPYVINRFDADIDLRPDGSMTVVETIAVTFNESRRGIFRTIPVDYETGRGTARRLFVDVDSVTDEQGQKYTTDISRNSGQLTIRVGDAEVWLPAGTTKTYVIKYDAEGMLNWFDGSGDWQPYAELYWNATGDEWDTEIRATHVEIRYPEVAGEGDVRLRVFAGPYGSLRQDTLVGFGATAPGRETGAALSVGASSAVIERAAPLPAYNGLTFVLNLPETAVVRPSLWQQVRRTVLPNLGFTIPIWVALAMFASWWWKGRDPHGGPVVVQYDAPDGISGPECGALIDERVDQRDMSSGIIRLAVLGYLELFPKEEKGLVFSRREVELKLTGKEEGPELTRFDKALLLRLRAIKGQITTDEMRTSLAPHASSLHEALYEALVDRGYYTRSPFTDKVMWLLAGLALLGALAIFFVFVSPLRSPIPSVVGVVLGLIPVVAVSRAMPRRTKAGAVAHSGAVGLEEFISRAKSRELKLMSEVEPGQALFEKLLPHAVAFGLVSEWADAFADILVAAPAWYHAHGGGPFTAHTFGSDLGEVSNVMGSAASTPPRSSGASGGSSGFGGGGFSGGGFGGGGGGSW